MSHPAPEPRTRVRLLGPLEVEIDGRDVAAAAPGRQARSVLAYLVANLERGAERDELVAVLWPKRPPKDPQAALRPILSPLLTARDKLGAAGWDDLRAELVALTASLARGERAIRIDSEYLLVLGHVDA